MTYKFIVPFLAMAMSAVPTLVHADTTGAQQPYRTATPAPAPSEGLTWAGIQLGPNFSTFTNLDSGESGSTEFEVGGFIDWHLQNFWYIETGLRYNTYGAGGSSDGFDINFHAHFIEIPLLLKPTFDAGGWYPYLLVGPNFGFKTGEGADASGNGSNFSASTSALKTFDFSMDFGLGAEIPIRSNFRAFAQFEYALGLTNILKDNPDFPGETAKTRGAMLMFGVMAGF